MCSTSCFYRGSRVDPVRGRVYLRWLRITVVATVGASLVACGGLAGQGGPPDPAAEVSAVTWTAPTQRLHVIFTWEMRDREARFSGQGVLRLDLGYRARVDLFGPRGETLSAAIIEGEEMRVVPPGTDALLPPPALLWSALGVFRPPADAPLTATTQGGAGTVLEYARDDVRWRFRFDGELLRSTEWTARGGRRTVELTGTASHGLPGEAVFRDWTEFRELTLRVTDVDENPVFTADVWTLPGR
ncbi:hypothetical protein BH23GEM9_BH23GEM9_30730 [soil metagenome]